MWKIRKEPENNRIVIVVTGDELASIIPDEVIDLVKENSVTSGDLSAEKAIEEMEKGVFEFYLQIAETEIEGF